MSDKDILFPVIILFLVCTLQKDEQQKQNNKDFKLICAVAASCDTKSKWNKQFINKQQQIPTK